MSVLSNVLVGMACTMDCCCLHWLPSRDIQLLLRLVVSLFLGILNKCQDFCVSRDKGGASNQLKSRQPAHCNTRVLLSL
jgi:hypothetical protein